MTGTPLATQPDSPRPQKTLRQDLMAGLINAVVSVPDGLASAALAGVNPVYGLYASMTAPIAGSLLVSAQLMQVSTTSASALAAGQAILSYPAERQAEALFALVILTGVFLIIFGVLGLGKLVKFVSHAVMTGFLTGVAVVLVLDQLAPLVGFSAQGRNEIVQFFDLLRNTARFDWPTIITGGLALALAFGLNYTRLATLASLFALVIPSLLPALFNWTSVQTVAEVSPIPRGLPSLTLPSLQILTPELLLAALALAVVIAVQGAGVSQSVQNPDGRPVQPSRDMLAQGVANAASGLLSGIPAGGSVGQTALNVSVGARTRWAGVFGGLWMLIIVLLLPGLIGQVPMAVLAALMIQAGFSALNFREVKSIWRTDTSSKIAILATFAATLTLSVPLAVAAGVVLTMLLFVGSSARDITVRELILLPDGRMAEADPPAKLTSGQITVLDVYGSLFFAGARTLADRLPSPAGTQSPVLILRLRGRTRIGSTLIEVLDEYADDLAEVGGRLYLSGVDDDVAEQLRRSEKFDLDTSVHIHEAGATLGESTTQAHASAGAWLHSRKARGEKQD